MGDCSACYNFREGRKRGFFATKVSHLGTFRCAAQDEVIEMHSRDKLLRWLGDPDADNKCKVFDRMPEGSMVFEQGLPLVSLTREFGNGIATIKYPNGSVYEYYGIEPPAYNKIRSVLYKKDMAQNVKASIILKKLKAGEKAGNYKVTKISEENVMDKIDKVVDKLLSEKDYGWDSDPENEVTPEKGERVVKFDFTSGAQDDLEDPHVSGTGKLTGKIVGGQYELEVIDSDNPQVEPGELFYLDDEDIIEVE